MLVISQKDKPKGRGKKLQPTPVKEKALEYGYRVHQPDRVRESESVELIRSLSPDLIVVTAFGQILTKEILDIPRLGCINVHASLLPKYRGAAPINFAVINGEEKTGITTMYMAEGLDTGDMILANEIEIEAHDTAGSLHDKLAQLSRKTLAKTLELIEKGEAYYCFCTDERLKTLEMDVDGKTLFHYDKHCLNLSREEIENNLSSGMPFVIRQNNPTTGETNFEDELYGTITVPNEELDDMILIKSDGYPTYNFANVVDDHLMGITHVVRGNEYLSSSPKYNRLYEAFGWEVPHYIHCPLITDENHNKLSKRSGHSSFEDLLDQGFLSEAVVNYVSLLGWCPDNNREIFSLPELIDAFDYHRMSKAPSVFDINKLKWMNGEYIKKLDFETFYEKALPIMKETIHRDIDFKKLAEMVQSRIEIFPDIKDQVDFIDKVPDYDISLYTHKKMKTNTENSLRLLQEVRPVLAEEDDYSNDALFELLKNFSAEHEYKTGFSMWPIRTALSGKPATPGGATALMELLGKDESIRRIDSGIEKLSTAN